MTKGFSGNNIPEDAKKILKQKGIDPNTVSSGDAKKILSGLNDEDAQKINRLLNDKDELNRLLNSDQAKQIMKQLFGNNGAK